MQSLGLIRRLSWLSLALLTVSFALVDVTPSARDAHDLVAWCAAHRGVFALSNELLGFGAALLAVSLGLAARPVWTRDRVGLKVLFSLLVFSLPMLVALVLVQGRIAYIYTGLEPSREALASLLSLYFAAQHMVLLVWGSLGFVSAALLGQRTASRLASLVAALASVLGSYAWSLPPWVNLVCLALFAAWASSWIARLERLREAGAPDAPRDR